MIFFSIGGIDDIPSIMGVGEEAKEVNFYNIIDNIIFKIDIFFFLIKIIY
jgi:hypothetical protein